MDLVAKKLNIRICVHRTLMVNRSPENHVFAKGVSIWHSPKRYYFFIPVEIIQ